MTTFKFVNNALLLATRHSTKTWGRDMDVAFRVGTVVCSVVEFCPMSSKILYVAHLQNSIAVPLLKSISFLRRSYLPADSGEQNSEEQNTAAEGTHCLQFKTSHVPKHFLF